MSSSLVRSAPKARAIVESRWIALRRKRTSSCYDFDQYEKSIIDMESVAYNLQFINQYRYGIKLVILILSLHGKRYDRVGIAS